MRPWYERCLDFLAPPRCAACGSAGAEWCVACGEPELLGAAGDLDGIPIVAASAYRGPIVAAIRRYKYEPRPELAAVLSRSILKAAGTRPLPDDAAWVPVPLAFERLVERGFNQSALLAGALARATRRPVALRALVRARDTAHQARLGGAERAANVDGAFEVPRSPPPRVLLVDDVVTTGATVRACASALARAGARVVGVFALARAGDDAMLV